MRGELTVPEEALKVRTPNIPPLIIFIDQIYWHLISIQHEKFTSGLQLSKKPSNGETTANTTTSNSPSKTAIKTPKSPSSSNSKSAESRAIDGLASSREHSAKPVDSHKAEERIGGELQKEVGMSLFGFIQLGVGDTMKMIFMLDQQGVDLPPLQHAVRLSDLRFVFIFKWWQLVGFYYRLIRQMSPSKAIPHLCLS